MVSPKNSKAVSQHDLYSVEWDTKPQHIFSLQNSTELSFCIFVLCLFAGTNMLFCKDTSVKL